MEQVIKESVVILCACGGSISATAFVLWYNEIKIKEETLNFRRMKFANKEKRRHIKQKPHFI